MNKQIYYNMKHEWFDNIDTSIKEGSSLLLIGYSGTGKTTIALQLAYNIIKDFEFSRIFHLDYECNTTLDRVKNITGDDDIESKYINIDEQYTWDGIIDHIRDIHDEKIKNICAYTYNTKILDDDGQIIYTLMPTVYIIDSKFDSKISNDFIQQVDSFLKTANIILIVISHIKTVLNDEEDNNAIAYSVYNPTESIHCPMSILFDRFIKLSYHGKIELQFKHDDISYKQTPFGIIVEFEDMNINKKDMLLLTDNGFVNIEDNIKSFIKEVDNN